MGQYIFGVHVAGLRHPQSTTSTAPILFTNCDIAAASLPAAFSTFTVLPWINPGSALGSYNWTSDPRDPLGNAGEVPVELSDTETGELGPALLHSSRSTAWEIQGASLSTAGTSIQIASKVGAAPSVNQVVWIENEAVSVGAVAAATYGSGNSVTTYNLTISRAKCGSLARYHRLDPANGIGSDDGSQDRLVLDSRPNFEGYRFDAAYYVFRVLADGTVTEYLRRFMFVDSRPRFLRKGVLEIVLKDAADGVAEHPLAQGDRQVTCSRKIQVLVNSRQVPPQHRESKGGTAATTAAVYFTRAEAERFFREPLHQPGSDNFDSTLITSLKTALFANRGTIDYYAEVEASGKWLYKINDIELYTRDRFVGGVPVLTRALKVSLSLVDKGLNQNIVAERTESTASSFAGYNGGTPTGGVLHYADGWAHEAATGVQPDEEAPKLTLRVQLNCKPVEALLYLAISDGAASGTAYDKIVGRVGAALNPAWFNIGSAAGSIASIDDGTTVLAERNQLLSQSYEYPIALKDKAKLGDFLNNLLILHACLFGPIETGEFCLRPWNRPVPTSPATLVPIVEEIAPGKRLPIVRQIQLESGFKPLTLEPEFTRTVRRKSAGRIEDNQTQRLRVWQRGNHISDADIRSGHLAPMVRAFLELIGGNPNVYEVSLSLDDVLTDGTTFGDYVYWELLSDDVPTEDGIGFPTSTVFIVLGLDVDPLTGRVKCRLIRDTYNDTYVIENDTGKTAPTLQVVCVKPVSSTVVDVTVESLGDASFNGTSAHGGIWASIQGDGGLVHVHRPIQGAQGALERDGYHEAYAVLTSITYDAGALNTRFRLTFNSAWARDDFTIASGDYESRLIVADETFISLSDYRPQSTTVLGAVVIEPHAQQLSAGVNFAKHSSGATVDKVRHRIAA